MSPKEIHPAAQERETGPSHLFLGEKPSDSYIQSLARGLAVIHSFNAEHPAQTLTQVAQHTGLTRAGARRILLTLEKLGYMRCEGRFFRLTPKILDLGFSYLSSMPFWKLAQPILEELTATVSENCSISVLDECEVVYVMRVPTRKIIMSVNLAIGSRLPAYCTAMGRVLLAGLPEAECMRILRKSPITAYTPLTKTDFGELQECIRECRAQGWASIYRELDEGLVSVAVPIRTRQGQCLAAINISGLSFNDSEEAFRQRFLAPLQDAARRISDLLV